MNRRKFITSIVTLVFAPVAATKLLNASVGINNQFSASAYLTGIYNQYTKGHGGHSPTHIWVSPFVYEQFIAEHQFQTRRVDYLLEEDKVKYIAFKNTKLFKDDRLIGPEYRMGH